MSLKTAGRIWEKFWPLIGAAAVVLLWRKLGAGFPSNPDNLFSASASVASVFASFLGVAKAIILSIKETETFKVLRDRGYSNDLFNYLRAGIIASVVFASLSILGFFIEKDTMVSGYKLFMLFAGCWIFFGALSVLTYMRISGILFKLLKLT